MFTNVKNIIIIVCLVFFICVLIAGGSYFYGRYLSKKSDVQTTEVNSTVILDRIQDNYFVVTKTVFAEEDTTIEIGQDSRWNNLLWGHTIEAEGTMRMDVGVDMNEFNTNNIKVDEATKKITINIPDAEILNTSLFGEMQIETQSGILKQLFENDKSADFNLALEQLREKAEASLSERPEIFEEAKSDSINLITLIVGNLGYQVEII